MRVKYLNEYDEYDHDYTDCEYTNYEDEDEYPCPECGEEVDSDDNYCSNCGTDLSCCINERGGPPSYAKPRKTKADREHDKYLQQQRDDYHNQQVDIGKRKRYTKGAGDGSRPPGMEKYRG